MLTIWLGCPVDAVLLNDSTVVGRDKEKMKKRKQSLKQNNDMAIHRGVDITGIVIVDNCCMLYVVCCMLLMDCPFFLALC